MELTAWGASAKEAADRLCVSTYTVQNHLKNIKEKLHLQKATEIAAAFFCMKFKINMDLSPMKRQMVATGFLILLVVQMCFDGNPEMRGRRVRTTRGNRIERRMEFEME